MSESSPIQKLLDIMERLRNPETGCPWDVGQDFASIAPYTVEEAYEVQQAIMDGDFTALKEELGDLLLQVVFHSQMAKERGLFDFDKVADTISDKLVKRHPHVFASVDKRTADEQLKEWEKQKADERVAKAAASGAEPGILSDVAAALPAVTRALKLQKRAADNGFDWQDHYQVLDKLDEEIDELENAIEGELGKQFVEEEIGDVMFACVNLARHLGVDAEEALKKCNRKFEQRFRYIEKQLKSANRNMKDCKLEELDAWWDEAKAAEKV